MRLFKRQTNPIFVEEEQPYDWYEKKGGGLRLLLLLVMGGVLGALLLGYL